MRHVVDESIDSVQLGVYHQAVIEFGHYSEWLLFIDSDEFFFGSREDSLPALLEQYEGAGGLAAHQLHFGSNNHVLRAPGLSVEAFTQRKSDSYRLNRVVKSAVRTKQLVAMLSPHVPLTVGPMVREHFDPLGDEHWWTKKPPSWDIVRCHHYHTRSMQDWVERRIRGSCNTYHEDNALYDISRFLEYNSGEMTEDRTILRFSDKIKEVMQ